MHPSEPTLDDLLNEPMIRQVMAADGYGPEVVRLLLMQANARAVAGDFRQPRPSTAARIGRLGYAPSPLRTCGPYRPSA